MDDTTRMPTAVPDTRILGVVTGERRSLLACIDVVVGYVGARHRLALVGWGLEAALVESRPGFRGGETVAIRATPEAGRTVADLPPVAFGVLREIASRISTLEGIANVVPDIAAPAPDVGGFATPLFLDDATGEEDARTA